MRANLVAMQRYGNALILNAVKTDVGNLKGVGKAMAFTTVCPYVGDDGVHSEEAVRRSHAKTPDGRKDGRCHKCRGLGLLTESQYKCLHPEHKQRIEELAAKSKAAADGGGQPGTLAAEAPVGGPAAPCVDQEPPADGGGGPAAVAGPPADVVPDQPAPAPAASAPNELFPSVEPGPAGGRPAGKSKYTFRNNGRTPGQVGGGP